MRWLPTNLRLGEVAFFLQRYLDSVTSPPKAGDLGVRRCGSGYARLGVRVEGDLVDVKTRRGSLLFWDPGVASSTVQVELHDVRLGAPVTATGVTFGEALIALKAELQRLSYDWLPVPEVITETSRGWGDYHLLDSADLERTCAHVRSHTPR